MLRDLVAQRLVVVEVVLAVEPRRQGLNDAVSFATPWTFRETGCETYDLAVQGKRGLEALLDNCRRDGLGRAT